MIMLPLFIFSLLPFTHVCVLPARVLSRRFVALDGLNLEIRKSTSLHFYI
jgi:hypothetical protein